MDDEQMANHLKWVLERQLHWINAADTKAAAVLAADVALAAIAGAIISSGKFSMSIKVVLAIAGVASLPSFVFAVLALVPRTEGTHASLIFFGTIKKLERVKAVATLVAQTNSQLIQDLAHQVHINATIASQKHSDARLAIQTLVIALCVWLVAGPVAVVVP